MNTKLILLLLAVLLNLALTGCGFVKKLFPDKEKDYQYTSEIAQLVYPKDLVKGGHPSFISVAPTDTVTVPPPAAPPDIAYKPAATKALTSNNVAQLLPDDHTPTDNTSAQTAHLLAHVLKEGGVQWLRVDGGLDTVWRAVNKALSRKSVEVTDRNADTHIITLRYDDPSQHPESRDLWHETLYILSGMPATDNQYSLKFSANGEQTDVHVTNEQQQYVADDSSQHLLTLIQDAL